MHHIRKRMKTSILSALLCVGILSSLYGQEIIPFPDLSEKHIAVYNQKEVFDEYNYSLFTEDYQIELRKIDAEIEAKETQLETSKDQLTQNSLKSALIDLKKLRSNLLEEAELVDDLNKFY